jgi:hypothetical protein
MSSQNLRVATWVPPGGTPAIGQMIGVSQIAPVLDTEFTTPGFPEAPVDAQLYGRRNSAWSLIPPTGIPEAPINLNAYGRSSGAWAVITKATVGLQSADNTADLAKPVSLATQAALDLKQDTIPLGTVAQYWRGDKTFQTLNKAAVGLPAVDNTSDALKPLSDAEIAALATKVGEAPTDGRQYGRQGSAWTVVPPTTDFVKKIGDTMTGPLLLAADPAVALEAATKQYVDAKGGLPEAPNDGKSYMRKSTAWVDADATFATDTDVAGKVAKAGDTMSGPLRLADGTLAAPALSFGSEPGFGAYRTGASSIAWAAGNTLVSAMGAASAVSTYLSLNPRTPGTAMFQAVNAPSSATNYNAFAFGVDAAQYFFLASKGGSAVARPLNFVGASAYNFDAVLGVNGDIFSGTALALMQGSTANPYIRFTTDGWKLVYAAGSLVWQSPSSVNLMTCDASGNLTMFGSATAGKGFLWGSGYMGLTSSGFRPSAPAQVVDIINASSVGASALIYAIHTPAVASIFQFSIGGGGAQFVMDGSGQGRSPNGWVATSDRSTKANLKTIDSAMAMVREWTGYTFDKLNWTGEDGVIPRRAGLIAQDIEQNLPEAVSIYDELRYLDIAGPVAALVNAVKELDLRLAALEQPA